MIWREQICVVYTKESKSALKEQVSSLLAEIPCIDGLICCKSFGFIKWDLGEALKSIVKVLHSYGHVVNSKAEKKILWENSQS